MPCRRSWMRGLRVRVAASQQDQQKALQRAGEVQFDLEGPRLDLRKWRHLLNSSGADLGLTLEDHRQHPACAFQRILPRFGL